MSPTAEPATLEMAFKGDMWEFMRDSTRYIDLEGAFRSGKTTASAWKVFKSCIDHPGINWMICRYSDGDTQSKLKPVWRKVLMEAGVRAKWDPDGQFDTLPNGPDPKEPYKGGSRVYIFGLKAQDASMRYAKLRGLTLAGIWNDQSEELPYDVYLELKGRMSQPGKPHQMILTPNPMEENSWLATEFPEDNHVKNHKYYRVSIYENEHNLSAETIPGLLDAYPVGHVKHGPAILGTRGLNVTGQPVYGALDPRKPEEAAFQRKIHEREIDIDPDLPLYESIDFGKHHPCAIWAQYTPWAELRILGGVFGLNLYLEDFAPIIQEYRTRWFPDALEIQTCCDPAGSHDNSQGVKNNGVKVLQDNGFMPTFKVDSNSPSVRVAMVERLAGYMRRRGPRGESFGIDNRRWVRVSAKKVVEHKFVADGCEAGYVWDEHMVSVGSKQIRKPKKDGWYEHGQNCMEYIEHNYGGVQPTMEQAARRALSLRRQQARRDPAEREIQDYMRLINLGVPNRPHGSARRGGY